MFKLDPSGHETILYSFTGTNGDGANPQDNLIMDSAGNLYGTTVAGGITTTDSCSLKYNGLNGRGTVFKIDSSGHEIVLYKFTGANGDGADPYTSLVLDGAGNLYGTTAVGGLGDGIVFKLAPSGQETVLYRFTGNSGDGANPYAGLIMDSAGNLYGTTAQGGAANDGTVFKLSPSGQETVLHSFTAVANGDGANPQASLVMDSADNLYGTTVYGGTALGETGNGLLGLGTLFKLSPSDQQTLLHSFGTAAGDGANPYSGLIVDSGGNVYGTASYNGNSMTSSGIVFELDPSGAEAVLHRFSRTDGDQPFGGVIMDTAGNLYGTTLKGGTENGGVVFANWVPQAMKPCCTISLATRAAMDSIRMPV